MYQATENQFVLLDLFQFNRGELIDIYYILRIFRVLVRTLRPSLSPPKTTTGAIGDEHIASAAVPFFVSGAGPLRGPPVRP